MKRLLATFAAIAAMTFTVFADDLPAKPTHFVTDNVGVLNPATVTALDKQLEQFERETSTQILVAVMPGFQGTMEEWTVKVARHWAVGQKDKNNGAVLFWFPNQRKVRIEVGYGLEGAITDSEANSIMQNRIIPNFKAGKFEPGIITGVQALMGAARPEFTGTGTTVAERKRSNPDVLPVPTSDSHGGGFFIMLLLVGIVVVIFVVCIRSAKEEERPQWTPYVPPAPPEPRPYRSTYTATPAVPKTTAVYTPPAPHIIQPEEAEIETLPPRPYTPPVTKKEEPKKKSTYSSGGGSYGGSGSSSSYGSSSSNYDYGSSSSSGGGSYDSGGGSFGGGGSSGDY